MLRHPPGGYSVCVFIKKGIVALFRAFAKCLELIRACVTPEQLDKKKSWWGERKESVSTDVWMSQPTGTPGLISTTWDIQGALKYSRDKRIKQVGKGGSFFFDRGFFLPKKKIFILWFSFSPASGGYNISSGLIVPSTSKTPYKDKVSQKSEMMKSRCRLDLVHRVDRWLKDRPCMMSREVYGVYRGKIEIGID